MVFLYKGEIVAEELGILTECPVLKGMVMQELLIEKDEVRVECLLK